MSLAKMRRRSELLASAGGVEPFGTGSPCVDCGVPRTILNTGAAWSDKGRTRLTFRYGSCDACRPKRACKRMREGPMCKLV
jgi:hypothetical protein